MYLMAMHVAMASIEKLTEYQQCAPLSDLHTIKRTVRTAAAPEREEKTKKVVRRSSREWE